MTRESIELEVGLLGATLEIDQSTGAMLCPKCKGGPSKRRKFSIKRVPAGLLYNCFRSSCDFSGLLRRSGYYGDVPVRIAHGATPLPNVNPFQGRTYAADGRDFVLIDELFGFVPWVSSFSRAISDNGDYGLMFPLYDRNGTKWGNVMRTRPWKSMDRQAKVVAGHKFRSTNGAKWMTYRDQAGVPAQSWYQVTSSDYGELATCLVVVEDVVSAIKAAQSLGDTEVFAVVALLGTDIREEMVADWLKLSPQEIIIALDQDATVKAIGHMRKWQGGMCSLRAVPLERDLKDEPSDRIAEVLGL